MTDSGEQPHKDASREKKMQLLRRSLLNGGRPERIIFHSPNSKFKERKTLEFESACES